MCHGLELRSRRQPYRNALPQPEKCSSTWLEYLKKYSVSDPTIGVKCNDGSYHISIFSSDTILTGNLNVYHILYTQPICASMDSPVSSHTARPHYLSSEHALVALYVEHPLELVTVTAALCKI